MSRAERTKPSERVEFVPRTKLWRKPEWEPGSFVIVLECNCGTAVDYPGHPDEATSVLCPACGKRWAVAA